VVIVLIGILFALAGMFALYHRGTTGWLVAGIVLIVIAVLLIFLGVSGGDSNDLDVSPRHTVWTFQHF